MARCGLLLGLYRSLEWPRSIFNRSYLPQGEDYARLPVIDNYSYLRNIHAPNGIFFSNKVLCTRTDRFASYSDESEPLDDIYPGYQRHEDSASPVFSSPPSPVHSYSPRLSSHASNSSKIQLPPISSLGAYEKRPHLPHAHTVSNFNGNHGHGHYAPLSTEDRRALQQFKVVL